MPKLTLLLILIFPLIGISQITNIKDIDITPPLNIPMYLSGTFGELRSNHFHAGIDIKTQGKEGENVIAIADGWVSRIKIAEGGYGKAIYITHNNGYVSVYGHLKKFNSTIQKIVVDKQYEKESYTVQFFPDKDEIKVTKGDVIAYSGNTGGSQGPHLHFEIREEKSQHPVNPLLNKNINIKDFYRPSISKLAIYPVDNNSTINGKHDTLYLDVDGWGLKHHIKQNSDIVVSGRISFGISTVDKMNDISNKNGVYSIKLFNDTTIIFHINMDELSFSTSRYINSVIDYSYYIKNKKRIVRTQVDTNNILNNYIIVDNNGIIDFTDTLNYNFTYEVKDAYNNTSKLRFKIKSEVLTNKDTTSKNTHPNGLFFAFAKKNSIITDSLKVSFPSNSFYQSFLFDFDTFKGDSTSFSDTYKLHNSTIPVHKRFSIKILPYLVNDDLKDKLFISYSPNNSNYYYMGSKNDGKNITCKSRQLGYYKIMADTVSPEIEPVNFSDNKKITNQKTLKIKILDKQTGISNYRATLNGNWILMEYNSKKNLLVYNFDDKITKGKNNFNIVVSDLLKNESEYNCIVIY